MGSKGGGGRAGDPGSGNFCKGGGGPTRSDGHQCHTSTARSLPSEVAPGLDKFHSSFIVSIHRRRAFARGGYKYALPEKRA